MNKNQDDYDDAKTYTIFEYFWANLTPQQRTEYLRLHPDSVLTEMVKKGMIKTNINSKLLAIHNTKMSIASLQEKLKSEPSELDEKLLESQVKKLIASVLRYNLS